MKKMSCQRCGSALTKGARFCTKCGATSPSAETADFNTLKTRPFGEEQTDQTAPSHSAVTEALPSNQKAGQMAGQPAPSDYDTEEMPRTRITARADESSTTAPPERTVTQPQTGTPPANQPSSGRKGLLLAAALGVIVLGAGSFFFINSRRAAETQAANQPADEAKPAASAQPSVSPSKEPSGRPSTAAANNQPQPQSEPAANGVKPSLSKNAESDKRLSQPSVAKPTPTAPQVKDAADGTGAAVHNFNQGVTYLKAKRYQDALREFEYVKKLDPGNKSVYYLIGQTYHMMGNLEQALEAYRRCTSGVYYSVALNNVKALEKRLGKTY
jgi:hypothetical protein